MPGAFCFQIAQEIFQRARFFFAPFKHQDDGSVPLVFPALEAFCSHELHGHMAVVTAGVHDAVILRAADARA